MPSSFSDAAQALGPTGILLTLVAIVRSSNRPPQGRVFHWIIEAPLQGSNNGAAPTQGAALGYCNVRLRLKHRYSPAVPWALRGPPRWGWAGGLPRLASTTVARRYQRNTLQGSRWIAPLEIWPICDRYSVKGLSSLPGAAMPQ